METQAAAPVGTFEYARPATLDEAFTLLGQYGSQACILSGGTDLIVQLRAGKVKPRIVIDLKRTNGLRADIVERDSGVEIGALALLADIIAHDAIKRHFPVLAEAAATVGSVQIRNRATLPGNICNASPAADTVPALLVHGAIVNLAGPSGPRSVALREFLLGPGKTARRPDEIVTSVTLPKSRELTGAAFRRLTRRHGVDLATINVCCLVSSSGVTKFAFGAVGPTVVLTEETSGRLADRATGPDERDALLVELIAATSPISDVRGSKDYRTAMLLVLGRRALDEAQARLHDAAEGG